MIATRRLRVGIVGLRPGDGWAYNAHLPALRSLPGDYELFGVANSSVASARAAAAACDISHAFASAEEMVTADEIDVVTVTVKVPGHAEIVRAALESGKHVYCEWPLGNGLDEAIELADLARAAEVKAVIGTQFVVAPEFLKLRTLVVNGYVGEVLSTTLVGSGLAWGSGTDQANAYLLDRSNGATMLTIPFGHAMAGVRDVLGDVDNLSALLANRRICGLIAETGQSVPMTSPDQVMMHGLMKSGPAISVHYRGGLPRGTGFLWEINGAEGDLRLTGEYGHPQMVDLQLSGGRTGEDFGPIAPDLADCRDFPAHPAPGNVARLYARMAADLRDGGSTAPDFEDAVALHRLMSTIERCAASGQRDSMA
jgi:predicted dehydrogenase